MKPDVSLIVPVYNVEEYMDRCVESLVNQSLENIEILLINDGSTDDSGIKCDEWAERDIRIRHIKKKNGGLGSARNRGIYESTADYLMFIDSDDWITVDATEKAFKCISETGSTMVLFDYYSVFDAEYAEGKFDIYTDRVGVYLGKPENIFDNRNLIEGINPSMWNKIYKKSLFTDNNIEVPEGVVFEDLLILPKLLLKSDKIFNLKEPLYYYYRTRPSSIINTKVNFHKRFDILSKVYDYLKQEGLFSIFYQQLRHLTVNHIYFGLDGYVDNFGKDDPGYSKLEKDSFLFLDQNFPEWRKEQNMKFAILGSYNSRAVLHKLGREIVHKAIQYSNSSLISLCATPAMIDKNDIELSNSFKKEMLYQDITKTFVSDLEELSKNFDYLVVDLLEERFNILRYKDTYITKSAAFCESNLPDIIDAEEIDRSDDMLTTLWKSACLNLINEIKKYFKADRVILNKFFLMEGYGVYGTQGQFDNLDEIRKTNLILKEYYEFFQNNFEGIHINGTKKEVLEFTDKYHIYGCFPYHANMYYYLELRDGIRELIRLFE